MLTLAGPRSDTSHHITLLRNNELCNLSTSVLFYDFMLTLAGPRSESERALRTSGMNVTSTHRASHSAHTGHFVHALRRGSATGVPGEPSTGMLSAARGWPRLAARMPLSVYDASGCLESDRLTDALLVENRTQVRWCAHQRLLVMRTSAAPLTG
jgi:hypothetical protein